MGVTGPHITKLIIIQYNNTNFLGKLTQKMVPQIGGEI